MSIMPPSPDSKPDTPSSRPPGVPDGARLVTLAQLRDEIAPGEHGSLRIGPRGSLLRCRLDFWPFIWIGRVSQVLGGSRSEKHGERVFSLRYQHGRRGSSRWQIICFTAPGAAERELWIWTIDDERRKSGAA